jgi:hypothetical protein
MAESSRGTKIAIAVLGIAVIALVIALALVMRRPGAPAEVGRAAPASSSRGEQGGFVRPAPDLDGLGGPSQPPAQARNELGQPLNEDGRPIGPPHTLARIRNKPIASGELPLTPPLFTDVAERAAFKRWWAAELGRRISIYEKLEPGAGYPSAADTAAMLDELYDTAEPRTPGETVDQAYARRQRWHALWKQFLDTYGATLHTVMSRGGDPQYGTTPAPPVQPPGVPEGDAEPAPPATDSPPGTDPGGPAGAAGKHD